jgi:hypothetical protein
MTFGPLNTYANGDTNYITKMDQDNATITAAMNALQAALGTGVSAGPYLSALLGTQTAFIGSNSFTQTTATTILTLQGGYVWRPDLGAVAFNVGPATINFSAQSAATYYVSVDATGVASISTTLGAGALYSVVWTGSAFGTITTLAPIVWNFYDWTQARTSTALAATYDSLDARLEAGEALIAGITTTTQTANKVYAGPVSGGAAAPAFRAVVVADLPFAGSASGIATLDGSGKVPSSQLPSAVTGALHYLGTWNATSNSPALASGVGVTGGYCKVATAGTTSIDGIAVWSVGDSIVFDGTTWDKIDGITNEVLSVAGKTGVVTLVVGDVSGAAPLASPTFTGTPAAPTASPGTNTTQLASTAFVAAAVTAGSVGAQADSTILANISGSSAVPAADTLTAILDHIFGSTRGMTLYRGASAWAALGAGTAGQFLQTQGTSGDPLWVSEPYVVSGFFSGLPTAAASKVIMSVPITQSVTFAANFAGCYLKLRGTTATASTAFDIQKNGSSIGTATIASSGSAATLTSSGGSAQSLAAGDLFALVLPATPDATADNMGWGFAGTR